MKTGKNQKSTSEYKIYVRGLKSWVKVTKEQYYSYYRDIWATRKRAQAHGQCLCPKSKTWLCDGDCLTCEFHSAGDNLSLDYTVTDDDGNKKSWLDDFPYNSYSAQSILEERELLDTLLHKLDKLDPDGRRICELIMQGRTERDSGKEMGIARNTFVYRRDKLLAELADYLRDFI